MRTGRRTSTRAFSIPGHAVFGTAASGRESFTSSCVFNVKKRSWKGGIQVAVVLTQSQIDRLSTDIDFPRWLTLALVDLADEDRLSHQERAHELFIQAVCWCKLDLALQAGITQENQCLADDTWIAEVRDAVITRTNFITSYLRLNWTSY